MKCAVSIDLDGIACYYRIHGLGVAPAELEHVILERALPRAAQLFAKRGLHVTWRRRCANRAAARGSARSRITCSSSAGAEPRPWMR